MSGMAVWARGAGFGYRASVVPLYSAAAGLNGPKTIVD